MNATLTIEGELDLLAEIAKDVSDRYGLRLIAPARVESLQAGGYTVESAKGLLRRLANKQYQVCELIVDAGGFIGDDVLRGEFGNERGQIKGMTGPISKHVKNMIEEGLLPPGTEPPTKTVYDPNNRSFQRAGGIGMVPELLVVFRAAFNDLRGAIN